MYGAIITPSIDADLDVFFLHNEGYSTMCGHAIIALTKLVFETGLVSKEGKERKVVFNVPAGKVQARATVWDDRVIEASFRNVPSFVYLKDQQIDVPDVGMVRFDVAYGGAFYAFVEAEPLGLRFPLQAPWAQKKFRSPRKITLLGPSTISASLYENRRWNTPV